MRRVGASSGHVATVNVDGTTNRRDVKDAPIPSPNLSRNSVTPTVCLASLWPALCISLRYAATYSTSSGLSATCRDVLIHSDQTPTQHVPHAPPRHLTSAAHAHG